VKRLALVLQERIFDSVRVWAALVGALVLVLIQIPPVEGILENIGVENSARLRWGILTVLLLGVMLELRDVSKRATPDTAGRQHFSDPTDMYDALRTRAKSITKDQQCSLDVLGLTLYSAWPQLSFWLQRAEFQRWTVRLATLSGGAEVSRWVPEEWLRESAHFASVIRDQAKTHPKPRLEVFEYDFVPSVHGFRLGNGDVFISQVLWQADGKIGKRGFSYEYIPNYEAGPAAEAFRNLFDNWFQRAMRESPGKDSGDTPTQP